MSVPVEVTLEAIRTDLVLATEYTRAAGLDIDDSSLSEQDLRFYVTLEDRDGLRFFAEFECREYPLHPPTVEFVSENRSERGARRLYPQGFHAMPCVCMRYNRKAYGDLGGPHGDWRLLDWRLPTGNGIAIDSLALMVSDLDSKVRQSSGKME